MGEDLQKACTSIDCCIVALPQYSYIWAHHDYYHCLRHYHLTKKSSGDGQVFPTREHYRVLDKLDSRRKLTIDTITEAILYKSV